jgi:hypothetical protein
MRIPVGYGQANLYFEGISLPLGAQVTLGFDTDGYAGTANDAANDILDQLIASTIMGSVENDVKCSGCLFKFGPNETGASSFEPASIVGTAGSDGLVPNSAYLIHKNTAFGGRKGRGRMYWPGCYGPAIDDAGALAPATVTALTADFATWYTALAGLNLQPALLHSESVDESVLPYAITSFTVDSHIGTQRRRLRR